MFRFADFRRWWRQFSASLAFKLSLIYGVSGLMAALFVLAFIYLQIMGALHGHHFRQVDAMAKRIDAIYEVRGRSGLLESLRHDLNSHSYFSSDLLIVVDPKGEKILGNLDELPDDITGQDYFPELIVRRQNRHLEARMRKITLPEGDVILVGRELGELQAFRRLIGRVSFLALLFGLLFTIVSTYWFRYELGASASAIRRTAEAIRAGRFRQRIPVPTDNHELSLLSQELNRMLDHMESALHGVRHVSDTIAHNLRTPIMRLRAILNPAARPDADSVEQKQAIQKALEEIHHLGSLVDKLLYIAEIKSGVQRKNWQVLSVSVLLNDLVDLYEPLAQDFDMQIHVQLQEQLQILGDADLLMSALSNLLDNALKFTKDAVWLTAHEEGAFVLISIRDNGPGVSADELRLLGTHFYRAQHSLDKPGSGLGLTSVMAIAQFLGGQVKIHNRQPGLEVELWFPVPRENE